jgi:putative transposase
VPLRRRRPGLHRPGSPSKNGFCESFNGRFRDESLVCEQFDTLLEVPGSGRDWRIEYNINRPHGWLDGLTPDAYRRQWINNQERLS